MRTKRFKKAKSGEWIQPKRRGYLMECCDCGLVHRFDFRVVTRERILKPVEGHVQVRGFRAEGHTRAQRRIRRIKVTT